MTTSATPLALISPIGLTHAQFQTLADVPPEIEWFANLTNANTRRVYRQDIEDFMEFAGLHRPEQFRDIICPCMCWRSG